ncbi:autotransporter domain-containing protein [Bradyrhizobium sp.]|uniref:autotransporter domain-containing protein n=1 Tax=Bradyrhizobium sp. TaxID=376 RepID=UPI0023A5F862|nr:autotransporter domain-containing protein [Bradyrhizobium sp.]MDE2376784.1 autotransporter domain-containing protein [Bradyrhizobium sp.]
MAQVMIGPSQILRAHGVDPRQRRTGARRRVLLCTTSLVALGWLATTVPSCAADNWTGAISNFWFIGANWDAGVPTSATDVAIGRFSAPYYPVIQSSPFFTADAQTGSILVLGPDSSPFAPGALTLQNGANLTNQNDASIVGGGVVTVTGSSVWTNTGPAGTTGISGTIVVGATGGSYAYTNFLNIQTSGKVITTNLEIGEVGAIGVVTVDGSGSSLEVSNSLKVGAGSLGVGTLTIQDGGSLRTSGHTGAEIGHRESFATSTITLKGQSSLWFNGTGPIIVGASGTGTLNIRDATNLVSDGPIIIARDIGSFGTLNIGAELGQVAAQPGGLTTPFILFGALFGGGAGTGQIVFNHTSSNYVLDAFIAGPGAVRVEAGRTILTANSDYTGPTTINGGILSINGSIASSSLTTVNTGGTLGGNGVVGNTLINGGTLSPGNSIGLLAVQGGLTFTAASTYLVEVSPANADRTNVTGAATLGGATVNAVFANGSYLPRQYTILNASGGVSSTFASGVVNTNLPNNFKTALSYDANDVYLNLTAQLGGSSGGTNGNQQSVANGINNAFNAGGALPPGFVNLFSLSGAPLANALTQISGETGTGAQQVTFNAMNQFMGVMTDPFIMGRGDPFSGGGSPNAYADENMAYASSARGRSVSERDAYAAIYAKAPPLAPPFLQRWNVWAAGFGGSQRTDGNAVVGSGDTRSSLYGVAVGADYRISPNTIAGFALAGGGTNFSVNNLGSGHSDLFQAGGFIRHDVGAVYLTGALAYGWQDIATDRTVTVAGLDQLHARFNASAWSGRVEGGYRFTAQGFGITPYAAGQFTTFELPTYSEQAIVGANTFALTYNARSVTDTRSELGIRTDKSFAMADGILTLRGRLAWAHDFNPDRNVAATFLTLPGASFVVNGAAMATDAALVTAAIEKKWLNGWSAAATFEGEFSNVTTSYAGKGIARYVW